MTYAHRWIIGCVVSMLGVACSDDGAPSNDDASASVTIADDDGTGSASMSASATDSASADDDGTASVSAGDTGEGTATADDDGESSGGSGTSAGDTGGPGMACVTDDDCVLVENCCDCQAIHVDDEPPPACPMECKATACMGIGVSGVHCEQGSCELDEVSCNPLQVACDALPPECDEGFLPSVGDACWTGNCVPAEVCDVVPDCALCPEDEVCIPLVAKGPAGFFCSPIAPGCAGTPSCACLPEVCPEETFSACIDGVDGPECQCPNC